MLSEKDLSVGGKVCKAIPYIYVHVWGLFFKIVKIENLAMLDRIFPCFCRNNKVIWSMNSA